jgi:hypothetical protein
LTEATATATALTSEIVDKGQVVLFEKRWKVYFGENKSRGSVLGYFFQQQAVLVVDQFAGIVVASGKDATDAIVVQLPHIFGNLLTICAQ